jgi:hypothetical protein
MHRMFKQLRHAESSLPDRVPRGEPTSHPSLRINLPPESVRFRIDHYRSFVFPVHDLAGDLEQCFFSGVSESNSGFAVIVSCRPTVVNPVD